MAGNPLFSLNPEDDRRGIPLCQRLQVYFLRFRKTRHNMDEGDNPLGQAFDYEDEENIAVTDVISFLREIRAAPAERIYELCNHFDDTDTMPLVAFVKLIQDFVEKKRNSFSEENSDDQEFNNTNSNLEGCGGDVSTISAFEPDVGELLLKNKNLSRCNSSLKSENFELRKQIDTYEEECEAQRRKIVELDKDLRQCQESKPNVQLLLKEKDDLLNRLIKYQEENSNLVLREKHLKEESSDYRTRLSCLQDQYDNLSGTVDDLRERNRELTLDKGAIKSECENLQETVDNKEEVIVIKTRECNELTERVLEYESTIDDLKEEKEALSAQVREVQFEYSICQKAVNGSAPGTPVRPSIQHELNLADDDTMCENYQSPICGTNYIKTTKQQCSPRTDTLRKGLRASLGQSSPFPREMFSLLKLSVSEVAIQTDDLITADTEAQTVKSNGYLPSQTEKLEGSETGTQTDSDEILILEDSSLTEEEDKIFDERSTQIQENINTCQGKIMMLERCNEELQLDVEREKSRADSLTTQLAQEQDKIAELMNANAQLFSSNLNHWWKSAGRKKCTVEKKRDIGGLDALSIRACKSSSLLLDALCLAVAKPVNYAVTDPSSLHGQHFSKCFFTYSENCKHAAVASDTLARTEKMKMQSVMQVLLNGLSDLRLKHKNAVLKLQQLFKISLGRECFCALDMQSVLKDMAHSEEIEIADPAIKVQIEKLQKYFDEMDGSIVTVIGRLIPSKFWLLVLLFLIFGYSSFRWEDYHIPQTI